MWARASDRPDDTRDRREAEDILARIACHPTYKDARLVGIFSLLGDGIAAMPSPIPSSTPSSSPSGTSG